MNCALLALLLPCFGQVAASLPSCVSRLTFSSLSTQVLDCIDPRFTLPDLLGISNLQFCSILCAQSPSCLAFAILTAPARCRRFNFGPFSWRVRSVTPCPNRTADVYVRNLPGVAQPGGLCGPGFGFDLMGTKFNLVKSSFTWLQASTHCESLGGQSRLAELVDRTDMDHAATIGGYPWSNEAWLNAFQPDGSVEPDQGWLWLGSGMAVNMSRSLWDSDDPDNDVNQNRIVLEKSTVVLNDKTGSESHYALCQCVSPFD